MRFGRGLDDGDAAETRSRHSRVVVETHAVDEWRRRGGDVAKTV